MHWSESDRRPCAFAPSISLDERRSPCSSCFCPAPLRNAGISVRASARAGDLAGRSRPACSGCACRCRSRSITSICGCCATAPGWTLVDTRPQLARSRASCGISWSPTAFAGLPVQRVICTHFHPDHFGLAGWLTQRFAVPLWMTEAEYLAAQVALRAVAAGHAARPRSICSRATVWTQQRQEALRSTSTPIRAPSASRRRASSACSTATRSTIDGRSWRVIVGYGHAPEHAALYCEEIGTLISGDMVLPKISTNVSVWPTEPDGDPLSLFLRSVSRHAAAAGANAGAALARVAVLRIATRAQPRCTNIIDCVWTRCWPPARSR